MKLTKTIDKIKVYGVLTTAFAIWLTFGLCTKDFSMTNYKSYFGDIREKIRINFNYFPIKNFVFTDAKTHDDSLKIAEEYYISLGREPTFEEQVKIVENYLSKYPTKVLNRKKTNIILRR